MLLFAGRTSFISSYSRNDMNMTDKCVVLRLHRRQAKDNNVQYQLNGESLRSVSPQRGLCVIVDEALKPMLKGREKCEFNNESHKGIIYEYHTYTF